MSLITKKEIVVKKVTVDGLICDRPCWLYWLKSNGLVHPAGALFMIYEGFFATGSQRLVQIMILTVMDKVVFKRPIRCNRGLFVVTLGPFYGASLGFIPDY